MDSIKFQSSKEGLRPSYPGLSEVQNALKGGLTSQPVDTHVVSISTEGFLPPSSTTWPTIGMSIITDPESLSGSPLAADNVFRDCFGDLQDLYDQQQINDPVLQLSQDWLGYLGAYDTMSSSMDTEPPLMWSTKTICSSIPNILENTSISYLNLRPCLLYLMVSPKLPNFALKLNSSPKKFDRNINFFTP